MRQFIFSRSAGGLAPARNPQRVDRRRALNRAAFEAIEPRVYLSTITFGSATHPGLSNTSQFVVSDDFNGDGRRDLACSSFSGKTLSVLLANGSGSFSPAVDLPLASAPDFVTSADLNNDGKRDLLAVSYNAGTVSVLLGNGNGTFHSEVTYSAGSGSRSVVVGDFSGDGKLDLAFAKSFDAKLTLVLGNGNGTFQAPQTTTLAFTPSDIVSGDFNHDGKLDLAAVDFFADKARILLNNGSGTFTAGAAADTGDGPTSIAAGDFNTDGNLDIAVANLLSKNVSVLLGTGGSTLGNATNYAAGNGATHVVVTDLDVDFNQDLVVTNSNADTVSVFHGSGTGTFQSVATLTTDTQPRAAAIDDFDGDGMPDLAVTSEDSSELTVFISTTVPADTTPPNAQLNSASPITTPGSNGYQFSVKYTDNVGLDLSTIGANDISVSGPAGFSRLVTFVSMAGTGNSRTVTYVIQPPDVGWTVSANGTYTISMRSNQVWDAAGNPVPAGTLGTFVVNLPAGDTTPPTAGLNSALPITTGGTTAYQFSVRYVDNVALNVGTLGTGDILVTGPSGYSSIGSFVAITGTGATRTVTYSVPAPSGGGWRTAVNGTYGIAVRSNQVWDAAGNPAHAGSIGNFVVSVPTPDLAGNTTGTARVLPSVGLGSVRTAEDIVSAADRNDFFKFTATAKISIDIRLTNLTDNADVQLLNSAGTRLAQSKLSGTANEKIVRNINAGVYYIRVLYASSGSTTYRLRVAGAAPAAGPLPDDNSIASARNIGILTRGTVRVVEDLISPTDSQDYLRFDVTDSSAVVGIKLQELSADANLELYDAGGHLIAASRRGGTTTEYLARTLARGTYYARVYVSPATASTTYRLRLAAA